MTPSCRYDHYVKVTSTVPAIAGQAAQIYVRERVLTGVALRAPPPDRVVLFVHGAGTPAEVAFDVPHRDYSWMAYLAERRLRRLRDGHHRLRPIDPAGADERSVQPRASDQQAQFVPSLIAGAVRAELPGTA